MCGKSGSLPRGLYFPNCHDHFKVEGTLTNSVDVCLMELTPTKLCWKRASQLVKVGGFLDLENLKATKKRCADALDLHCCHKTE